MTNLNSPMNPKISIITVVYNNYKGIKATINSVISQIYLNKEYIIIDGGSNDGTLEIIKSFNSHYTKLVSEKDKGIYYAMNKGIDIATGEWIIFMNSGDSFYNENILMDIFNSELNFNIAVIYGGTNIKSSWGEFEIKPRREKEVWKSFCHQSMFVRREILKIYKFNTKYKAASDSDLIFRLYNNGYKFKSMNLIVSTVIYESEGFTAKNQILSKKEVLGSIISNSNKRVVFLDYKFLYHLIRYLIKFFAYKMELYFPGLIKKIRILRDIYK